MCLPAATKQIKILFHFFYNTIFYVCLASAFSETKGNVAPVVVVSFVKSFCLRIETLEFSTVGQKHSGAALGIEREREEDEVK